MGLLAKMDKMPTAPSALVENKSDEFSILRDKLHIEAVNQLNRREEKLGEKLTEPDTRSLIEAVLDTQGTGLARPEKARLAIELYDQIRGLGPLEKLIADNGISEIMVNGPKQIYIERKGKLTLSDVTFIDEEQLLNVIDRIVAPLGRHIDEATPMVDARLSNGSRVNAVIPPPFAERAAFDNP